MSPAKAEEHAGGPFLKTDRNFSSRHHQLTGPSLACSAKSQLCNASFDTRPEDGENAKNSNLVFGSMTTAKLGRQGLPMTVSPVPCINMSSHSTSSPFLLERKDLVVPVASSQSGRPLMLSTSANTPVDEQFLVSCLFKQLEIAISQGQHEQAAFLARELAMHKVTCSLKREKQLSQDYQQSPFVVKLYVEDKHSHWGPIPLQVFQSMTLKMLKHKVEKEFEFPAHLQRWILGKSLAIDENASLASYGVKCTGCPIFLYLLTMNPDNAELDKHSVLKQGLQHQSTEQISMSESPSSSATFENESDLEVAASRHHYNATSVDKELNIGHWTAPSLSVVSFPDTVHDYIDEDSDSENYAYHEVTVDVHEINDLSKDYLRLVQLDEQAVVPNSEPFECLVCFNDIPTGEGIVLRDCLHPFCRECLICAVQYSEDAVIKCPFRNEDYSCSSQLQDREIKSLVSEEMYERFLQRSMATAENRADNSFHCKYPDCPGWCFYEDNVNLFLCPVCRHVNCLTCQAIHEGKNCLQYQDELEFQAAKNDEAKRTKEYLEYMLTSGDAVRCPQCHVIVMKKWGCDWVKCSVCQTEICWITKGPRWGPAGRGDTSGGCKCGVNGVRCHPQCTYCH